MSRKICVVTGTRAEFGLLRPLMQEIQATSGLELQVVVTGMHLSPEYGSTYREVEQAGFSADRKVEMLLGANTASAVTKSVGLGTIGFADAYEDLEPDLIVVLGDRFELLSAVTAALIAGIPVAHIHGGETTEGAFDEAIRHSVTKMSQLHFVGAPDYRRRVIQLGEQPERVFVVGGLGIDVIKQTTLLDRAALEQSLGFGLGKKNLLITFHPVTLEGGTSSVAQMNALLAALDELEDTHLIFTMPNADTGGRELAALVEAYVRERAHARVYSSLGYLRYLSCMQFVDGVVGNSSSGLAEAPSMRVGTVDIGDRQKGRLAADSVLHCEPELGSIRAALQRLYDPAFTAALAYTVNPYGDGGASKRIAEVLRSYPLENILKKSFHDLPVPGAAS
jgi:GDP/UDP-N,N'-diacetylbacillosamine 2-epimerase (hydrolysing)